MLCQIQEKYSQHAVDSLIVENGVNIEDFERIIYEFIGCSKFVSKNNIENIIKKSGVQDIDTNYFIQILCERCFLGRKVGDNVYRYQLNFLEGEKIEILAKHYLNDNPEQQEVFEINQPFRKFFEIN